MGQGSSRRDANEVADVRTSNNGLEVFKGTATILRINVLKLPMIQNRRIWAVVDALAFGVA